MTRTTSLPPALALLLLALLVPAPVVSAQPARAAEREVLLPSRADVVSVPVSRAAGTSPSTATRSGGSGVVEPADPQSASGLGSPPAARRLGLPVALAVVALLGVASLLVRVLLAEPVRR